jgi:putative DNA primase/helicase
MDAGNLMPVAEAARKVALAVDGRLAVPDGPGDANDLFCAEGPDAVAALAAGAVRIPPPPPTYPAPVVTPKEARAGIADAIAGFMAAIPDYWAAVEAAQEEAKTRSSRTRISHGTPSTPRRAARRRWCARSCGGRMT